MSEAISRSTALPVITVIAVFQPLNGQLGYAWTESVTMTLAVYNLLDSNDNDISYYYASQLAGETAPVEDIHFHPVEPRNFRLYLTLQF